MTHHRHTVKIPLRPQDYPILSRVLQDPALKVMVFCAAEGHGRQDIAFPHQSEIKVNGGEVKANLRGLKNKPGSTRPVDITKELRLNLPAYSNTVEMTYALTSKVGSGSQVSCLNPHPLFSIFPSCFSPLRRSSKTESIACYRNSTSSYMWSGVYLSRIL
jgi:hypothetical protein